MVRGKKIHWEPVSYADLNARAKENFNYAKLSAILADYGFVTIRLTDDWNGADLIARNKNGDTLPIQLKSRLAFERKYLDKGLYIAFFYHKSKTWYLYPHDELLLKVFDIPDVTVWKRKRGYTWNRLSRKQLPLLEPYKIVDQQTIGVDTEKS